MSPSAILWGVLHFILMILSEAQDAADKGGRALKRLKALMPAYDVETLICEGGETWYSWVAML